MTDFRALCAELVDALAEQDRCWMLINDARAALAQPEPAPTDEELLQLAKEWNSGHESIEFDFIGDYARAVLARWGHA
jgi:hypothetical protein